MLFSAVLAFENFETVFVVCLNAFVEHATVRLLLTSVSVL